MATPVSAACPSAALKNAIRRVTTRWLNPPRIGARTSTQRKPRIRNGYWKSLGSQPALREIADPVVESGQWRTRPSPAARDQREHPVEGERLGGRPFGDERSIEHRHPIGDTTHLVDVVRHHQNGASRISQRAKEFLEQPHRRLRRGRWRARRGSAVRVSGRARWPAARGAARRPTALPAAAARGRADPDLVQQHPRCASACWRSRRSRPAAAGGSAPENPRPSPEGSDRRRRSAARSRSGRRGASCATMRPSKAIWPSSALEQRGLAGAVGTDDHMDGPPSDRERRQPRAAARGCAGSRPRRTRGAAAHRPRPLMLP